MIETKDIQKFPELDRIDKHKLLLQTENVISIDNAIDSIGIDGTPLSSAVRNLIREVVAIQLNISDIERRLTDVISTSRADGSTSPTLTLAHGEMEPLSDRPYHRKVVLTAESDHGVIFNWHQFEGEQDLEYLEGNDVAICPVSLPVYAYDTYSLYCSTVNEKGIQTIKRISFDYNPSGRIPVINDMAYNPTINPAGASRYPGYVYYEVSISASDPDGESRNLQYHWEEATGKQVGFFYERHNETKKSCYVYIPFVNHGRYSMRCIVTDEDGDAISDIVRFNY